MARRTKIKETAVVDSEFVSEEELTVELTTLISNHITDNHTEPVEALPYYYDAVRGKNLSHQETRIVFDSPSSAIANNYLTFYRNYDSSVKGFTLHDDYCLVGVEYKSLSFSTGNIIDIMNNIGTSSIHPVNLGLVATDVHYNGDLNINLSSGTEISALAKGVALNKPILSIFLRKLY